jgi:hypothetical protein
MLQQPQTGDGPGFEVEGAQALESADALVEITNGARGFYVSFHALARPHSEGPSYLLCRDQLNGDLLSGPAARADPTDIFQKPVYGFSLSVDPFPS